MASDVIRAVQITDTHLYADPNGCLLGVPTEQTLRDVLDCVAREPVAPDLVLATGDLVHDASDAGYRRVAELLGGLGVPVYCLPGNHDELAGLLRNLDGHRISCPEQVEIGPWLIPMLDTTLPDSEGGHLARTELARLDRSLADHPERHAFICMHHPPAAVGSRWLDTMQVDNPDALAEVLGRHRNVRGLLCGHVHQVFETRWAGVPLMASPSTCVQFAVGSQDFGVDPLPPGYRWLELYPDGRISSRVERVLGVPAGLQMRAGGY